MIRLSNPVSVDARGILIEKECSNDATKCFHHLSIYNCREYEVRVFVEERTERIAGQAVYSIPPRMGGDKLFKKWKIFRSEQLLVFDKDFLRAILQFSFRHIPQFPYKM